MKDFAVPEHPEGTWAQPKRRDLLVWTKDDIIEICIMERCGFSIDFRGSLLHSTLVFP